MKKYTYPNFPKDLIISDLDFNRYTKFINSRPIRKHSKDVYTEKHHIVPKSLSGSNNIDNFIRLTGREHFIAHLILAHAFGGPMITALWMMTNSNNNKLTSKQYANLSEDFSKRISKKLKGRMISEETKNKMKESANQHGSNNSMFGKKQSELARKKISDKNKGFTLSDDHKEKLRIANTGRVKSEEEKNKLSKSLTNISLEQRYGKEDARIRKNHLSKIRKGKTYEQLFGVEEARKLKKQHSEKMKGRKKGPISDEHRKHISESKKGQISWNKGIPMSDSTKEKQRQAKLGKKYSQASKDKMGKNKGKVSIHKDGKRKYISYDELNLYLEQGYTRGYPKKEKHND
jgi:hypothetical protein